MNPFNLFGIKPDEYQLVVVLQGEQACWYRCRGRELTGSWCEPLKVDSLKTQARCPWLMNEAGGAECRVHLVLDTGLDEVDRVKVDDMSEGWMQAVQRLRMARRLRADYPLASIHQLPDYALPDVFSIVHHLIPPAWEDWLRHMQSLDVCFTHVVTSLELFCERLGSLSFPEDAQTHSVGMIEGPVLFDVPVGKERRHLLMDKAVPLFMRMVNVPDKAMHSSENAELHVSLRHACDQITHDARIPLVLEPLPPWPELAQNLQAGSVLAALSVGTPVSLQQIALAPDPDAATAVTNCEAGTQSLKRSRLRRISGRIRKTAGSMFCRLAGQQRWRLMDHLRFSGDFLQPSIISNRQRLRIRQLQKATLICAWMAAGSVVIASTHGINSARQRARISNDQQQLTQQIDHLAESVNALNNTPDFVARSLARIDAHERVKPVEAIEVLATVARAVDEFPAIVLDSLSWSVMTDDQPVDLAFTAMSQVARRGQLWQADMPAARMQVDIAGTVSNQQGLGLREQQTVLQSFADHLQAMPKVAAVQVLEAPVNAARSSRRSDHGGSGYHLSLQLGEF